jgi:hypothetical protein
MEEEEISLLKDQSMHYGDTESGASFDYCVYVDVLPDKKDRRAYGHIGVGNIIIIY